MKKFLLLVSIFFLPMFSYASSCNISGTGDMPEAMVQQLKVQCEKMKLESAPGSKLEEKMKGVKPEDISAWAEAGTAIAKTLGAAAKEVGVSVNEFIKTPAGWLVVAIILWNLLMADILLISLTILAWGIFMWKAKDIRVVSYSTEEKPGWFGSTKIYKIPVYGEWSEATFFHLALFAIPGVVMTITTLVNLI